MIKCQRASGISFLDNRSATARFSSLKIHEINRDSKVHGANMGPIWGRQMGPMLAPWTLLSGKLLNYHLKGLTNVSVHHVFTPMKMITKKWVHAPNSILVILVIIHCNGTSVTDQSSTPFKCIDMSSFAARRLAIKFSRNNKLFQKHLCDLKYKSS